MIVKATILFLFGTVLTHGAFIAPSKSFGCPAGTEMAPVICKFMQPNMDVEFKPPLIAPTTYIAPLVIEKCNSPQIHLDIEMPAPLEESKPLVIPQPPELPPMTIQKFPVPVIIEAPPASLHEPCESADISVMPVVNVPTAPEIPPFDINELPQIAEPPEPKEEAIREMNDNTIEDLPVSIPQPPELPAFIMPEISTHLVEQEAPSPFVPCAEDKAIPAPISENIKPQAPLPAAPELPAFTMPEMPIPIMELPVPLEPAAPEIPPCEIHTLPQTAEAPEPMFKEEVIPERNDNTIEDLPVAIPQPPELPAFIMPEIPTYVPCSEDKPSLAPISANTEPQAPLPAAPELPAFTMPEMPIQITELPVPLAPVSDGQNPALVQAPLAAPEIPPCEIHKLPQIAEAPEPIFKEEVIPEIIDKTIEYLPVSIPQPPELPAFIMPEIPTRVPCSEDNPSLTPISANIEPLAPLPDAPELPAFTMPELPIHVVDQKLLVPTAPCFEDQPTPLPIPVPQPSELPAIVVPEIPAYVAEQELPMPPAPSHDECTDPTVAVPEYIEPLAPLPAAPELPAFTMPELPIHVVDQKLLVPTAPCFEDQPTPLPIPVPQPSELPAIVVPEIPAYVAEQELPMPPAPSHDECTDPTVAVPEYIEPLAPLPAAPELPAFTMPELPIHVVDQKLPVSTAPCSEDQSTPLPIPVPQPSELPAFVVPEIPAKAAEQELQMPSAPSHHEFIEPIVAVSDCSEPLVPIPSAPELPPVKLPELPLRMEIPSLPVIIPQTPKVPGIIIPEVQDRVSIEKPSPCVPYFEMGSPFYQKLFPTNKKGPLNVFLSPIEGYRNPKQCVYNLVMKHVVPHMLTDNYKFIGNFEILPAGFVPCS